MNPIEQFEISPLKELGTIGAYHFIFTNSAAYMFLCVAILVGVTLFAMRGNSLVPGRLQSAVETIYEFIADTVRQSAGEEGMKFFPFVFSLFAFILLCNFIGLVPYSFTVTSQIIVTASLALLVFAIVIIYGFWRHGLGFLHLFAPSGAPGWLMPLIVVIELMSFLLRPLSLSVRLFANMLAGHIALARVRRLRRDARRSGGLVRAVSSAAGDDDRAPRARGAGGFPAGLCVRHFDLHLSQRRPSPAPLTKPCHAALSLPNKIRSNSWIRPLRDILPLALPV